MQRDLEETAGIRVEVIPSLEEAERLVSGGKRSAVLVFGPAFSERVHACSFLARGINPFSRRIFFTPSVIAFVESIFQFCPNSTMR